MAEITRETLELAALAAGIKPDRSKKNGVPEGSDGFDITGALVIDWHNGIRWRPHIDDGDTARLQVLLNMDITVYKTTITATVDGWDDWASVAHDGTEPDKLRAWREAVVLCAAAVGERMQKGGA